MFLIKWLLSHRHGEIQEFDDRIEIRHDSGEYSTLFKSHSNSCFKELDSLGDIYTDYDGADLFSSTFKNSSCISDKYVDDVALIESINSLSTYSTSIDAVFPEKVIPFMYQAGIGIYALGLDSKLIYEWDQEENAITESYISLEQIFEEWLSAVE